MRHGRLCFALLVATLGCERTKPDVAAAPPTERTAAPARSAAVPSASAPSASDAGASPVKEVTAEPDARAPARDPRLPGRIDEGSGSTAVHTRDGKLFIAGQDRPARHTHGGAPARIGQVTFAVTNDGAAPRTIEAKSVELLHDSSCEKPASTVRSKPKLASVMFDDDEDYRGATTRLAIPPGSSKDVVVQFEPVEAYMAWCDRFAIRVGFSVDGKETLSAVADLRVIRVQPLRE